MSLLKRLGISQIALLAISVYLLIVPLAGNGEPLKFIEVHSDMNEDISGRSMWMLKDQLESLSIDQIMTIPLSEWMFIDDGTKFFPSSKAALWFQLNLHNIEEIQAFRMLCIEFGLLDYVDIYVKNDGNIIESYKMGDMLPMSKRAVSNRNFLVALNFLPLEKKTVYLRVQTRGLTKIPVLLRDYVSFSEYESTVVLLHSLFFGALLVVSFFNLFLFVATRASIYLYFTGFAISEIVLFGSINGFAAQYFWPEYPGFNLWSVPASISLTSAFSLLFSASFLRLKQKYSILYALHIALASVFLVFPLITPFLDYSLYRYAIASSNSVSFIVPVIILVASIKSQVEGNRYSRYFTIAWFFFLVGNPIQTFSRVGLLPSNALTENAVQLCVLAVVLLMSFALSDRINEDRKSRVLAQRKMHESEVREHKMHEQYNQLKLNAKYEELEAEKKVIAAKAESRAKGEFLATMSHEIRTPMNGVLGMAELLKGTELSDQQRQYLSVISSSGKALLNIINDILDYSKIIAGKMKIESINIDLEKFCTELTSVFRLTAANKRIEFFASISPETQNFIKSDPTRLRQILINLLGNAAKFTHQGSIQLRISEINNMYNQEQGHLIKFEVIDTGIGIDESNIDSLFDVFSQADKSTTRQFGGTGLGLSISKRLSETLGGEIGVKKGEENGTVFWFTIRCKHADESFVEKNQSDKALLTNKRLLYVDDSEIISNLLKNIASSWGVSVDIECDLENALNIIEEAEQCNNSFEIVMIDLDSEEVLNSKVIDRLNELSEKSDYKLVLLSSMLNPILKSNIEENNVNLMVAKPVLINSLQKIVLRALDEKADISIYSEPVIDEMSSQFSGLHVLVAEDNPFNQMVVKGFLSRLGLKCTIVDDGKKALDYYVEESDNIDIILMDCEMPNMDGYEASKAIREWEQKYENPTVPIIALTAHVMRSHHEKSLKCGMNAHLGKPVEIERLKVVMAEQLFMSVV